LQLRKQVIFGLDERLTLLSAPPSEILISPKLSTVVHPVPSVHYLLCLSDTFNKTLNLEEQPHPGPVLHSHESSYAQLEQKRYVPKSRVKKEKQVNPDYKLFT
jgi:hypothetical protein